MNTRAEFDSFADTYDTDLNQALSVSGETKDYFARARVRWLEKCLNNLGERPRSVMDYGCGIGDTTALLEKVFGLNRVLGLDVSMRSLEVAHSRYGSGKCSFSSFDEHVPAGDFDLVYCNGVFHHIPVAQRSSALRLIYESLRPGGIFALWENNPWNPGTRYVMSKCAFDRDAVTIPPPHAVHLVREAGFQVVGKHFLFFFPRFLRAFRFLEPRLSSMPVGAQFQVLCRKPAA